ncbi:MAG: type II toxin-antitoxin system RelE/ParE family toxin [Draconibacterium sp.]
MEIVWSAKAKITFFNVLDYLDKNWTKREINQFYNSTEVVLKAIKVNPGIFPLSSKHKEIRKAIVDKNNSFFYTVDTYNRKIFLLTFFDNRQNPEKLTL